MVDFLKRYRLLVIIGVVFVFVFVVGLLATMSTPTAKTSKQQAVSPATKLKQETTNPTNLAPDYHGTSAQQPPLYDGFSSLIDNGITMQQMQATETAFTNYSQSIGNTVKLVSVDAGSINMAPIDPNSDTGIDTLYFNVKINDATSYQVTLDYSNLTTINMSLYSNKKLVYNSGDITQN
jgi:hypothetical protein